MMSHFVPRDVDMHGLLSYTMLMHELSFCHSTVDSVNLLPHKPILGSSNSAANKEMMSKILTNGDTIFCLSRKHCGKRGNCSLRAISSFPTMFSKAVCC